MLYQARLYHIKLCDNLGYVILYHVIIGFIAPGGASEWGNLQTVATPLASAAMFEPRSSCALSLRTEACFCSSHDPTRLVASFSV